MNISEALEAFECVEIDKVYYPKIAYASTFEEGMKAYDEYAQQEGGYNWILGLAMRYLYGKFKITDTH